VPLGLYISIPFCKTKCSYCNFASDVFSRAVFRGYVDRLCADINHAKATAQAIGGHLESSVDSIYLGGGTPTVLDCGELERLFLAISQNFDIPHDAEITVECAPGTLNPAMLDTLCRVGVNRVSLGVQSFVDREASAVGRLHDRSTTSDDIARLRAAGISSISVDLIAGLPYQTVESWQVSLNNVIDSGVPHASVYMLEVDEDSRLGRELIAGGTRYHAHHVPDEDLTASLYETACDKLNANGLRQYEISNFAREGFESRHNLKYWTRQPYFGFGVDAHSMLPALDPGMDAVRFSSPESLEQYVAGGHPIKSVVDTKASFEETFFLGLRLIAGVDLDEIERKFGQNALHDLAPIIDDLQKQDLLEKKESRVRLTDRGRMLSNEVFQRFLGEHSTPA
jgi:oxygen-independent coproporphyrinogen-3 oxidase